MLALLRRGFANTQLCTGFGILSSVALLSWIGTTLSPATQESNLPAGSLSPSAAHWLGTDDIGRDILRMLLGSIGPAYLAGLASIGIVFAGGTLLGAVAGYRGGVLDWLLRQLINMVFVIPELLQMLFMITLLTSAGVRQIHLVHIIIASSLVGIPGYALLVRNLVLAERQQMYPLAAYSLGLRPWRIALFHIVPNILPSLLAFLAGRFKGAILVLGALSFMGLGYNPRDPHLGQLLNDGQNEMMFSWWRIAGPLLVIWLTMLGANLISDAAAE
jgi:peptide/nickel transport system permease protein